MMTGEGIVIIIISHNANYNIQWEAELLKAWQLSLTSWQLSMKVNFSMLNISTGTNNSAPAILLCY